MTEFMCALAALFVGLGLGAFYGEVMHIRYLIGKAADRDRTPAKLGDAFYYIVPESEYVSALLSGGETT